MTACSEGSDGDNGGGNNGGDTWYVRNLITSFPVTSAGYGYYKDYVLAHIDDLFRYDGRYDGHSINVPNGQSFVGPATYKDEINVIHITDDNTIEEYDGYLYKYGASGASGMKLLYRVSSISLGEVAFYASSPHYYTYSRDGNLITFYLDNTKYTGTITSDGLVIDGEKWTKFKLGHTYTDNNNDDAEVSESIEAAKSITKTAIVVGNPTFHKAVFRCTFGTSNSGNNVGMSKVFAFSKNKSDLENASELARRYHNFDYAREVKYPVANGSVINLDNGYLEDGDLRFADENTGDLNNFTAVYDDLNVTIYYCPMICVANTAVTGEIKSVELRKWKQTSGYIDLGLSCQWASTNYRTSSSFEVGSKYTLLNSLRNKVGDDGRLPTKAEVEELNKCKKEFVDDGILVTGLNGNQIYLPYCTKDGSTIYPGYGISDIQGWSGTDQYDMYFFYDSSVNTFRTNKATTPFYKANIDYSFGHAEVYVRAVTGGADGGNTGGGDSGGDSDNLVLSTTNLEFPSYGGTKSFSVTTKGSWMATCDKTWITLTSNEGSGNGTVYVQASTNTSEDDRSAVITIQSGSKSYPLYVTQKGVSITLTVTPGQLSFQRNGGKQTLKVTSDTDWKVSTNANWLSLSKSYGYGNDEVEITALTNTGNARNSTITFTHNNVNVTVKVSQKEKPYIPFDITNVIVMNTNGGSNSTSIINMEKDGLYVSKLEYLSERITFNIKTYGTYTMSKKWYFPGSSQPERIDTYNLPFSYYTDNPLVLSVYNTHWKPSYYKTGTYKWEYYYEDELIYTKTFTVY